MNAMTVYLALITFAILMMVVYFFFVPQIYRLIKYLESKGDQAEAVDDDRKRD